MVIHRGVPDTATGIAMLKRGAGMKNTAVGISGTSNIVYVTENGKIVVRKKGAPGAGLPAVKECVQKNVKKGMTYTKIRGIVKKCGEDHKDQTKNQSLQE